MPRRSAATDRTRIYRHLKQLFFLEVLPRGASSAAGAVGMTDGIAIRIKMNLQAVLVIMAVDQFLIGLLLHFSG
jgi:hypothetical protein